MNAAKRMDVKAWLQELKGNRRTQVALAAFVLVLIFVVWSWWPSKPVRRTPAGAATTGAAQLGDHQMQALETLPHLSRLGRAGELPTEDRVFRDLFLFDAPQKPEPVRPAPVVAPPPPPTEAQIRQQALLEDRNREQATRPQDLRYLGFLERKSSSRIGGFMRGDEPMPLKLGAQVNPQWKLRELTDKYAEFQNLKYPDLTCRIEVRDSASTPSGRAISNEF